MPRRSFTSKAAASAFTILALCATIVIITVIMLRKPKTTGSCPTVRPLGTGTVIPRLPRDLIPHSYRVYLQPHFYTRITVEQENTSRPDQTTVFTGNSTVYFHCVQATRSIYLNSRELSAFDPVVMDTNHNRRIEVYGLRHHRDASDFLEIQLRETLEAGEQYSLSLAFNGSLSEELQGLFLLVYDEGKPADENDATRFLVATNMEPADARRVFPCLDEPEMKAVFNVTIIHRQGTVALGNAGVSDSGIIDDDWQYTSFHPTPKMSTYLFAFVVSEFTSIPSTHERVDIKIFARPEVTAAGHTEYAANITGRIVRLFESYFDIDYQQRSLDHIALPELFNLAMENWGLITYQEESLFYEEGESTTMHKELIASLIAHEVAHQWFGNLVTMKWWNEIWLNEGFATYMTNFIMDHTDPTFNLREILIMADLSSAFYNDISLSSHPMSAPLEHVQTIFEINSMFSAISYSKGSVVLRMLADTIGESVFHKGIKMYLSDFSYKNTEQSDIWKCIQKAVDEDGGHTNVAAMMHTWTNQSGFPIITINTTDGEIHQKHFLLNGACESSLWWHVPIRIMSKTSESSFVLTTSGSEKREELISKSGEWILANVNYTGYFIVNYNPENWQRLQTQLETDHHMIPLMNRGQLIVDAFTMAKCKLADITLALNMTRYLRKETAFIPWNKALTSLETFNHMFDRSEVHGHMQVYLREQVRGVYNLLRNYTHNGKVPEDHSLQHIQIIAIQVACANGLPECIEMASKMFASWMKNSSNRIHPNLRPIIYCQAIAAGGKEEWEFIWRKLELSNDSTRETGNFYQALSCTKKVWLLNRYLEYTLNPDKIRDEYVASTIDTISNNVVGHALAWNFIRAHWKQLQNRHAGLSAIFGVAKRFSTQFELEELQRFTADSIRDSSLMDPTIEKIKENIQWVNEHKDTLLKWFERESDSYSAMKTPSVL